MLTDEQKKLVEDNEKLIYEFAKQYNLSLDVYYGILAIALCKSAINYMPEYGYTFSTYAYHFMRNAVYCEWNAGITKKRTCPYEKIFLDAQIDDMDFSEVIGSDKDDPYILIEGSSLLTDLYSVCNSDKDVAVIDYIVKGYTYEEISNIFNTSRQNVYQRMLRIRDRYIKKYGGF